MEQRPPSGPAPAFIADVHLGKLARNLRMLGFDTWYEPDQRLPGLLRMHYESGRILLSRNRRLPGNPFLRVLLIESEAPNTQLLQLTEVLGLAGCLRPFTRCMVCNGLLFARQPAEVAAQVPHRVATACSEYWQCPTCNRLYWKGTHYDHMCRLVARIQQAGSR